MIMGQYLDLLDVKALVWLHQFIGQSRLFDAAVTLGVANNPIKFGPLVLVVCWLWFDKRPKPERRREKLISSICWPA